MNNFKRPGSPVSRFLFLAALVLFLLHTGISNSFANDVTKEAQASLLIIGVNAGPVDGKWGPRTQRGVWAFQEMEDLPVSGKLDAATVARLSAKKNEALAGEKPAEREEEKE